MIWRAQLAICLLLSALTGGDPRYHYSSWSDDPEPYREAIRKTEAAPPLNLAAGERICAGIVTHHFLASGMMVRFFAGLQAQTSGRSGQRNPWPERRAACVMILRARAQPREPTQGIQ